ncbi:MAG TPA: AAA family ATPase [Acidimicrobiia bacterium]
MGSCGACGAAAATAQRFCGDCGAPLAQTATAPATQREERKVVTAVFVDLVGSTAHGETLDIEDVHRLLHRYHQSVRSVLARFGGTVEKFIGDAVVGVFGAPMAHEDDAERAVRAALETIAVVGDLDAELHVRVGVATGEALVDLTAAGSDVRGMASGDVLNTAARLQAAAPVDGVLVSAATERATVREIVYETAAPVIAKGKSVPVLCARAVRPRSRQPEQQREHGRLLGRERESELLADAFEACRHAREVRLLTIVGVPGIGKSRLVEELGVRVDALADLVVWRHGRVVAYGDGGGLWAFEQIVKQECGIFDSDTGEAMRNKVERTVASLGLDGPDGRFVSRQIGVLLGLDAELALESRRDAIAGWRMFVTAVARRSPTVLVFDDIHWADRALLELIEDLASRIVGAPLLVVTTARPELDASQPDWGDGGPLAQRIDLAPLPAADVAAIVRDRLGTVALAVDVERRLVHQAAGNPLFALEYARSVAQGGVDETVPETVQSLIAARVDRLDARQKWFMQRAAILGDIAWLEAVRALDHSGTSLADDERALAELERLQFVVRRRRSSIEGTIEFEFSHTLVREVAYGQLPRPRRREGHEHAALWLRRGAAGHALSEQIAHHLVVALDLARDLHEPDAALRVAAAAALVDATAQASARHDHNAVIRYSDRALDLAPAPRDRASLVVARELARHADGRGDHDALVAACDAALGSEHVGDAIAVLFALSDHAELRMDDAVLAETYAQRAAELASDQPPGPITALGPYAYAFALNARGCYREAIELCTREIARADACGAAEAAALLRVQYGRARCIIGDAGGAAESELAARVLLERRHPRAAVAALSSTSNLHLAGANAAGRALLADAILWARQNTPDGNELLFVLALAAIEAAVFDADGAASVGAAWREIEAIATRLGEVDHDAGWLMTGARLWHEQLTSARPDVSAALRSATAHHGLSVPYARLTCLAAAAFIGAVQGDPAAHWICDDYLDAFCQPDWDHGTDHDVAQIAIALAAIGRRDEIGRLTPLAPIRGAWLEVIEALASNRDEEARTYLERMRCDGLAAMLPAAVGRGSV